MIARVMKALNFFLVIIALTAVGAHAGTTQKNNQNSATTTQSHSQINQSKPPVAKKGEQVKRKGAKELKAGFDKKVQSEIKKNAAPVAKNRALTQNEKIGILREASGLLSGNKTLKAKATRAEAAELGKAWVGPKYTIASDGETLLSSDGLRQYRPPTAKQNSPYSKTGVQANFQKRRDPNRKYWTSNAHLDVWD